MESTAIVCHFVRFFFFHVFKLFMTFFPSFIYTWSLENRVSQKKLILPLGNSKQKNDSNPG